jgi:dynein heavy chain
VIPEGEPAGSERTLRTHFIIFGKFDAFGARCEVLIKLFTTIDNFNKLRECRIEGMEAIVTNFADNDDFTKRSNNTMMLDPRNQKFSEDYRIFETNCALEDAKIRKVLSNAFSVTKTVQLELELHESLKDSVTREEGQAELELWFKHALQRYQEDVESVRTWFNAQQNDPPIPKNMPPIAGRIAWVRQLIARINGPMEIFRRYDAVLNSEKSKKVVANFNKTLLSLVTYERNCQKQFQDESMLLKKEMANNLIKLENPMDKRYVVNFAQDVMRVFQEANVFKRFGFDLPKGFDQYLAREQTLKYCRSELHNLLVRYHRVNAQIDETFPVVFDGERRQLAKIIEPGCQTLSWSSLSIDKYFDQFRERLAVIEEALNKVSDIRWFSINHSL